jgi:hypothetical protein
MMIVSLVFVRNLGRDERNRGDLSKQDQSALDSRGWFGSISAFDGIATPFWQ